MGYGEGFDIEIMRLSISRRKGGEERKGKEKKVSRGEQKMHED